MVLADRAAHLLSHVMEEAVAAEGGVVPADLDRGAPAAPLAAHGHG
jgi:hypothetical protein